MTTRNERTRAGRALLRAAVDAGGALQFTSEPGLDLAEFRRSAQQSDKWLEALEWVDGWARDHGIVNALRHNGISLWWFVRTWMIERFVDVMTDVEALAAVLRQRKPARLRLENANEYWSDVCEAAANSAGIGFEGVAANGRRPASSLRARIADACVSLARICVGAWRTPKLRTGGVLTLGYATWRRVIVDNVPRFIDPAYELAADRLKRAALPMAVYSAPAIGTLMQQLTWLVKGNPDAVPVEYAMAKWWLRSKVGSEGVEAQLRERVHAFLAASNQKTCPWKGHDLAKVTRRFLATHLEARVTRAAWLITFFEHILERSRPGVLFLCHEYSGMAMAACAAARGKGIPVVAVQHGVIWRAHYGYVLPRDEADTVPRANRLCVFGQFDRDLILEHGIYSTDEIVITGAPRLDLFIPRGTTVGRQGLIEQLGLPEKVPLVLFTSIGDRGDLVARLLANALSSSECPVVVIVKLHPSADAGAERYSVIAAERGIRNLRVVREDFDLYDLFRNVDVHMSVNSTSLSEAVLFNKPNIMLGTHIFTDTVGYLERNVAVALESYPSLSAAVADVLDGAARDRLARSREAFMTYQYFKLDGRASERVAGEVGRFVNPDFDKDMRND